LPQSINEAKEFKALKKALEDHLYRSSSVTLLYSPVVKAYSQPEESEREFRMRLQQMAREDRDAEVDKIEKRYQTRLRKLQDRRSRAEAALVKKRAEADARQRETLVSVGESVVGMFVGRRSMRVASTALSKQRQASSAKMDVAKAEDAVEAAQQETKVLEQELQEEVAATRGRWDEALGELEEVPITPRKSDIQVDLLALAWAPHWQITYKGPRGSTRAEAVPAYE